MFAQGEIIYFTPFFFPDGQSVSKPKYFIILGNVEDKTIIATLPTRTNNAPSLNTKSHGCNNHNERKFNCYVFSANTCICDNGFSFYMPTYIYGNDIENYEVSILKSVYTTPNADYRIEGKLKDDEFAALMDCLKNSNSVKNKIKRSLFPKTN